MNIGSNNNKATYEQISNLFYLGFYETALDDINDLITKEECEDCVVLKCKILLSLNKYQDVKAMINQFKQKYEVLKNYLALTNFIQSLDSKHLSSIESDLTQNKNKHTVYTSSLAYLYNNDYEKAYKILSDYTLTEKNLELEALKIQTLLFMNRVDYALKALEQTKEWAEDVLLIQIVEAIVDLKQGNDRSQAALFAFEEMDQAIKESSSIKNESIICLNGKIIAHIQMQQYEEVDDCCSNINSNSSGFRNTALLSNLITNSILSENCNGAERYQNEIKSIGNSNSSNDAYIKNIIEKESIFDKCASQYLDNVKVKD